MIVPGSNRAAAECVKARFDAVFGRRGAERRSLRPPFLGLADPSITTNQTAGPGCGHPVVSCDQSQPKPACRKDQRLRETRKNQKIKQAQESFLYNQRRATRQLPTFPLVMLTIGSESEAPVSQPLKKRHIRYLHMLASCFLFSQPHRRFVPPAGHIFRETEAQPTSRPAIISAKRPNRNDASNFLHPRCTSPFLVLILSPPLSQVIRVPISDSFYSLFPACRISIIT